MSAEQERFMAFEGFVQWTQAVVRQGSRVAEAFELYRDIGLMLDPVTRRQATMASRTECHLFSVASRKLIEHLEWVRRLGLCSGIDFSEIDAFSRSVIKDLRDMHEHILDYFQGSGLHPDRWVVKTPEFTADASSVVGELIGGRLNWRQFADAAAGILPALLREPIPYPSEPLGLPPHEASGRL